MLEFETLLEQYENIEKLASGGQKVVYSAEHPLYGAVVLKICKNKSPRLEREIEIITTGKFENSPKYLILEKSNIMVIILCIL